MLYCPNYSCQAPNSENHQFCERCRTRLPKRYLWAIGQGVDAVPVGQYLGNRYLCKAPRIFLDTQPGFAPDSVDVIPDSALPYIKLNAYQVHIPQAYGWALTDESNHPITEAVLLLERGAIVTPLTGSSSTQIRVTNSKQFELLPSITEQWPTASAMRQLNWLAQMAKLWQPLASEYVVSTLLNPELIRTEDALVRLAELQHDQRQTAGVGASLFYELGILWQQWVPSANPTLQPFLKGLCHQLTEGSVQHPGQLVACLDRALVAAGRAQNRQIQFASQTDKGPTRPRNEDACYPKKAGTVYHHSKNHKTTTAQLESSLVIVCDGIGGHLGGAVASSLAIDAVYQHLRELALGQLRPLALITELRKAACAANDLISERNDQEDRRDRERMGTTLVMGLVQNHELYVTHLGDSRAYLITRHNCHQITLDDDVASREARLGYGLYRNALTRPGSGSLVQALGMSSSGSLHPTVQRLVLDGEGVLLLCSDGLSDNDLIDSLWQSHLRPLLNSDREDLAEVVNTLLNEANQKNGHDNVTVSLIRWSAHHSSTFLLDENLSIPPKLTSSIPGLTNRGRIPSGIPTAPVSQLPNDASPTKIVTPPEPQQELQPTKLEPKMGARSLVSLLVGIVFLIGLGGVLAYVLLPSVSNRIDTWLGLTDSPLPNEQPSVDPENDIVINESDRSDSTTDTAVTLKTGAFVEIIQTDFGDRPESEISVDVITATLYPEPSYAATTPSENESTVPEAPPNASSNSTLPLEPGNAETEPSPGVLVLSPTPLLPGTILKIIRQQADDEQNRWIHLRVCQIGLLPSESREPSEPTALGDAQSLQAEPLPEPILRVGHIGWMAETDLRTVADLSPTAEGDVCHSIDPAL